MNIAIRSLALASAFALAACGSKETPAENMADNQAEAMENQADTIDEQADATQNEAAASVMENQADMLENKAEATREAGEKAADRVGQ